MKIVICDDSIEYLLKIEKLLFYYQDTHNGAKFEIEKFSDAAALYRKIQQNDLADIYILDMIMADKNGIDIGNQIRRAGCNNAIIYITTADDFALDAYSVHAVRYLLKPISEHSFFEALDYALSYAEVQKSPTYAIKTKDGLVSIPYSKIEYIENSSRILDVHLTNGQAVKSIFLRKSFDEEIREIICRPNFVQVHKSFLINLNYVKKLAANNALMETGETIPISKKRAADIKKEYLLYISNQHH